MSFSQPTPPNASDVSNTQLGYNQGAATFQQGLNSYNQYTPYGSSVYTKDANSPSGYSQTTALSPQEQALFNQFTGNQSALGQTAGNLVNSMGSQWSQGPNMNYFGNLGGSTNAINGIMGNINNINANQASNLDPSAVTNKEMGWEQQYMNPIFQQQQATQNAQLAAQGLGGQGSGNQAYNNAQNLLARNQGDVTTNFLMQAEPQAYQQALSTQQQSLAGQMAALGAQGQQYNQLGQTDTSQMNQAMNNYQMPAQLLQMLMGGSSPQNPNFQSTPQEQVQPPNYQQAAQNQYLDASNNFGQTMGGLGSLLGIGGSIFGMGGGLGGLFGGSPMSLNAGSYGGSGGQLGGLY